MVKGKEGGGRGGREGRREGGGRREERRREEGGRREGWVREEGEKGGGRREEGRGRRGGGGEREKRGGRQEGRMGKRGGEEGGERREEGGGRREEGGRRKGGGRKGRIWVCDYDLMTLNHRPGVTMQPLNSIWNPLQLIMDILSVNLTHEVSRYTYMHKYTCTCIHAVLLVHSRVPYMTNFYQMLPLILHMNHHMHAYKYMAQTS